MKFQMKFTNEADSQLQELEQNTALKAECKAVKKTLGLMEINLLHPSLKTHKYFSLKGPKGEEVFEAYAQGDRPNPYRIFWLYGPQKGQITIIAIVPHP